MCFHCTAVWSQEVVWNHSVCVNPRKFKRSNDGKNHEALKSWSEPVSVTGRELWATGGQDGVGGVVGLWSGDGGMSAGWCEGGGAQNAALCLRSELLSPSDGKYVLTAFLFLSLVSLHQPLSLLSLSHPSSSSHCFHPSLDPRSFSLVPNLPLCSCDCCSLLFPPPPLLLLLSSPSCSQKLSFKERVRDGESSRSEHEEQTGLHQRPPFPWQRGGGRRRRADGRESG